MTESNFDNCRIIELERHLHDAGTIAVAQNDNNLPFPIRRIFYIYDIPSGSERGAHSHRVCQQIIVAASGSFDVCVTDGDREKVITLNRPYQALYIPAGLWISLRGFSSGSLCLTLCSHDYDDADYIRDYNSYLKSRR